MLCLTSYHKFTTREHVHVGWYTCQLQLSRIMRESDLTTGSPDVLLVKLIYKTTEPNMYVKLQAKLTAN